MRVIVLLGIFLLLITQPLCAQQTRLDARLLAEELDGKDPERSTKAQWLFDRMEELDSAQAFRFVDELAEAGRSKGLHFQARLNCIKARTLYVERVYHPLSRNRKAVPEEGIKKEVRGLLSAAMDIAYQTEDEYLMAFVGFWYAVTIVHFGESGMAVMYGKNSIDLYERLSYEVHPASYQFLAELLYKVKEYGQSVYYGQKAVTGWQRLAPGSNSSLMNCMNTVALGYHRRGLYDSALNYYGQALEVARQQKDGVWEGIVNGNIGQILYAQKKYDSAYALFRMDYRNSRAAAFYDNAANSLQWAARANLARGKNGEAIREVREAFQLLKLWPDAGYLRNACFTASLVFQQLGAFDSAFYYTNRYTSLHDSLEKVAAESSLSIAKARLGDEMSRYQIQNLKREKERQVLYRNLILAAVVVSAFCALLIINRQRLSARLQLERIEQDRLRMEQEAAFARGQLEQFTQHIIEKTDIIERLEHQLKGKEATAEQQAVLSELSRLTLLTDEDWIRFKSLFTTIYPGFFANLKEKFPDCTLAEQRMAALTRLHLTTKQIASMIGISVDSVHKSRQRLRQRFQVSADTRLEKIVSRL